MKVVSHVIPDDVVDEVIMGVEPPTNSVDVVDEVIMGVEPPTNSFDFVLEVNMGVEPPTNSFAVKNKIKNDYVKTKNVLDNELIEFYIALNKSIAALARKANIREDENMDGFDPWLFISPLLCNPEEYDERDIKWREFMKKNPIPYDYGKCRLSVLR